MDADVQIQASKEAAVIVVILLGAVLGLFVFTLTSSYLSNQRRNS